MTIEIIDEEHQPLADEKAPLKQRIKTEWSTLFALGTPILIGQLAQMANGVIDTIMAGRASADDLTGVSIAGSLLWPLMLFCFGLLNAQQPIISGHKGAREENRIMAVLWNTVWLALICSVLMVLLLNNAEPVLNFFKLEDNPARITMGYLQYVSLAIPSMLLLVTLRGFTDGIGSTKTYMKFAILSTLLNAPLNYIFIYGKLGMPAMGGIGCGLATSLSTFITLILMFAYLAYGQRFREFHLWGNRQWPNRTNTAELLRLGIPIGFTTFVESIMFALVALMLAPMGSTVVAGHQISLNVVSLLFMVPLSIGMALTIRIAFLIGAKQLEEAALAARSTLVLVTFIGIAYAAGLFAIAEPIASLYSREADVIVVATLLLGFGAMFQIADILQVVAISALRGYRDTRIPMYIMLASFWGIGIPLGYILAYKDWFVAPMGASGFWIGMIAGLSHAAFWLILRVLSFTRQPA